MNTPTTQQPNPELLNAISQDLRAARYSLRQFRRLTGSLPGDVGSESLYDALHALTSAVGLLTGLGKDGDE